MIVVFILHTWIFACYQIQIILNCSLDNIFTSVRKCSSKKSQITYVSK